MNKLICLILGWWDSFRLNADYPVSGHNLFELQPNVYKCVRCGEIMDFRIDMLTDEEIIEKAIVRAEFKPKPYWTFIWKDPDTGLLGIVNFSMPEARSILLFEKTHPNVTNYRTIGADK